MPSTSLLTRTLCGLVLLLFGVQSAAAFDEEVDFSEAYELIFQIRVVSEEAGGKSSIGSGFQVSTDGLIITNYHVVSEFVNSPDHYQIKYVSHDGKTGFLNLLDFDIVNDLAVLRHPQPASDFFLLASSGLDKGEMAYALGNPGDWGIVMVPGPSNGLVEHRYEERILFSGSLNAGMSGGPSVDKQGNIMGVNVATAGSQLSFLVPVKKVENLLSRKRHLQKNSYELEMAAQIREWQRHRIQGLLDSNWEPEVFNSKPLFGEIRHDFQCWGDTNETDNERAVEEISKSCSAGDSIYISSGIDTGQIDFSFTKTSPIKLNAMQFSRTQSFDLWSGNYSDFEHSTDFRCETDFVVAKDSNADNVNRMVSCIRAYKKFPSLYDSMLLVTSSTDTEMLEYVLRMSAMEKDQILAMHRRFVEQTL